MKIKINKAFTLIEILIVISIIGILTSLAVVSYTTSQKQARDVERKSDLSQYRTALENYANTHNSFYPIRRSEVETHAVMLCDSGYTEHLEIKPCPNDPKYDEDKTDSPLYHYLSSTIGTTYVLWANSETKTDKFWVVCSNGQSGYKLIIDFDSSSCPNTFDK